MSHLPSAKEIEALPTPLRVLVSGCLAGELCGYDGTSFGEHAQVAELLALPLVHAVRFCPENFSFGTPREVSNVHGGNGHDVLAGRARVLTHSGEDWTGGMVAAAKEMLRIARKHDVHLAILLDISAACGSQVIYDGHRDDKRYQKGPGVCAALLIQNGIKVISQRDYRTLGLLRHKLDPNHKLDETAVDHHETAWYREYFSA